MIAVLVDYIPCTETKGSRVRLIAPRLTRPGNKKGSKKFLPFDHAYNGSDAIAIAWLSEKGIPVTHEAEGVDYQSILFVPFTHIEQLIYAFNS